MKVDVKLGECYQILRSREMLKRRWILVLLVVFTSALVSNVQCSKMPDFRSIEDIGNPLKDPEKCGQTRRRSNICDPDNIISEEQATQLDGLINSIYNNTACACSNRVCREGFSIGIAMIKNMKVHESVRSSLYTSNGDKSPRYLDLMLNEAKIFSYTLLGQWNMSKCQADLLIFYSMNDNVLYTTTNNRTRHKLTDALIGEIWLDLRKQFSTSPGGSVAEGFAQILAEYNSVFLDQYKRRVMWGRDVPDIDPHAVLLTYSTAAHLSYLTHCCLIAFISALSLYLLQLSASVN